LHPGRRADDHATRQLAVVGAVQLHVGKATVIVDHAVGVGLTGVSGPMALGAVAVRPVAGAIEALETLDVEMKQRPGLGPLIAAIGLAGLRAAANGASVSAQHLPDRRAMAAADALQASRAVVGALASVEDLSLSLGVKLPGTAARAWRARSQALARGPLGMRRRDPAVPPTVRGGRRLARFDATNELESSC